MPRVKKVRARKQWKDFITGETIEVGEEHYTWTPYRSFTRRSKQYPKRSMLTQSESLGAVYDAEDAISEITDEESAQEALDLLNNARDICDESADNIEEYFEYSERAEELRNTSYSLDDAINQIENLLGDDEPDFEEMSEITIDV